MDMPDAGARLTFARARLIVADIPPAGARVRLTREEASHARALRLRRGQGIVLLDGSGREAPARVVGVSRRGIEVEVEVEAMSPEATPASGITLLVAAVRAERLAWLVEKATELGAGRVILVQTARTQSFRARPELVGRLDRVARAAAKQSDQAVWPTISGPISLSEALSLDPSTPRFILDPHAEPLPPVRSGRAAVLVGPEGGWTPEETESASAHGWRAARLPAGKLRTETAAITALALLRAAMEKT
jgi:16S rRNA (uracil1498-N3)-methyltransferase